MKSEYSVTTFSNRWPFTIFCSILNISTISSQIVFRENTNTLMTRRQYIFELAKQPAMPHLYRRFEIRTLLYQLTQKIRNITEKKKPYLLKFYLNSKKKKVYSVYMLKLPISYMKGADSNYYINLSMFW